MTTIQSKRKDNTSQNEKISVQSKRKDNPIVKAKRKHYSQNEKTTQQSNERTTQQSNEKTTL